MNIEQSFFIYLEDIMVKKYNFLRLVCIVVLATIVPFVAKAQIDPGIDPDLGFSYLSPRFLTKGVATDTLKPIGPAFTSYSISPALSAGLSFNTSTGNITGTPADITGAITYTIVGSGGGSSSLTAKLVITVNDKAPAATLQYNTPNIFTRNFAITSLSPTLTGDGGVVTSYRTEPSLPAGLSIDATGVISGTPTVLSSATDYTVIAANTGGYTLATVRITVRELIPDISYNTPNVFTKGTAISSLSPTNTGGLVVSYRILTALPAGLSFNTSTGVISGTPSGLIATTNYSVIATNTGGSDTTNLDITVNDVAPNSLSYTTPNIFYNTVTIGNLNPTSIGGAIVSYSISPALSAGLSFNTSTGVISGTPTVAYPITEYTVTATNTGGSTAANFSITVRETAPYNLSYTSPNIYTINYTITPLAPTFSGGQVTNFNIEPSLPAGLTFSSTTGNISGTPTALSDATIYTVTATNSAGSGTATLSIKVEGLGSINNQPSTTNKQYCLNSTAIILSVTATGSNLTYQWYYNTTNTSDGATLISGATQRTYLPPTVTAGEKYYYVRVTSPNGYDMNSNFSGKITINPLPIVSVSIGNSAICVNGTSTLNNTTDPNSFALSGWRSMNTGIATVNATSGLVTGISGGTTKILFTVTDAKECQNSDTTLFTVSPLPSMSGISGNTPICRGDSANYFSYEGVLNKSVFSGIPQGASYSLRTINSYYFLSPAIKVRRTSDNATRDIGFTSNGDLDTAALKSFVGALGTGYIDTWYDQSGQIRNLTQTNFTRQPRIINSGIIYRKNAQPTLYYDTDDGLGFTGPEYLTATPFSINLVAGSNSANTGSRRAINGSAGRNWLIGPFGNKDTWYNGGFSFQNASPWPTTSVEIFTAIQPAVATSNAYYRNGENKLLSSYLNNGVIGSVNTGAAGFNTEFLDGFISEITAFRKDLSANQRLTLEASQSAYYNPSYYSNIPPIGRWSSSNSAVASVDSITGKVKAITGGTAQITYTLTNPVTGCNNSISKTVTVNDPITISTQPSTVGETVCKNSSATALTVVATSPNSITGYQWFKNTTNSTVGGTAIGGATSSSYTPVTSAAGTTYYYVRISELTDCNKLSEVSGAIVVRELPTTLTVTSPQNLCSAAYPNPIISDLNAGSTVTESNTVKWYTASTGGTALLGTQTLSSTTYYVAQTDGTCESVRSPVVVNLVTTPAAPTASSAQSFCSANNATVANLTSTAVGTNTIKWYSSASLGSSILSGTVSLTTATTYYTTQTNSSGCESSSAPVTVTINPTPSAPTASTQNLCASTIPTVGNLVANLGEGNTAKWYTVAVAGSALSNTTTIVNSGVYYVAQLSAANCESARIPVNVIAGPTSPLMSANTCVGNTIAATLVDRNATALNWYKNGSLFSTINTFTDTMQNVSTTLSNAQNLFIDSTGNVYVISNHSILLFTPGSSTGVVVAGISGSAGSGLNQLSNPTGVYVDNSKNIYVADPSNSRVIKFPAGSGSGTNGIVVAQSGGSNPAPAPHSVFVDNLGRIYTGTNYGSAQVFRYPANSTASTPGTQVAKNSGTGAAVFGLYVAPNYDIYFSSYQEQVVYKTANESASTTGTVVAGTLGAPGTGLTNLNYPRGIFVDNSNNLFVADLSNNRVMKFPAGSSTTTPGTVATSFTSPFGVSIDASTGNIFTAGGANLRKTTKASRFIPNEGGTYTVTYTNGTCATPVSASITVTDPITITTQPSTAGQTVCKNSTATSLTVAATVSGTTINGYQWYSNTTNSTVGGTAISSATSSSYTPTTSVAGTTYYYAKIITASGCSKLSSVSGAIVVKDLPTTLTVTSPQTICSAVVANPIITDLSAGSTVTESNTVRWYTALTGGTALSGTQTLSTTTYYVAQFDGTCESVRSAVVVNIVTTPAAPTASSAQSFCSANNATVANLSATAVGTNTIKWYSSASLGSSLLSGTVSLTTGTTYYTTQTTSTGCQSGSASVTVTINPTPSAPTASTQNLCASTIPTVGNLVANVEAGNTAKWYTVAIAGSALSNTTTIVNSGVYYVAQLSAANCESGRTAVNVIAGPTTPLMSAGVCVGNTIAATLVDRNATTLSWYKNGSLLSNVNTFTDTTQNVSTTLSAAQNLFIDSTGNVYVANAGNHTITMFAPGSSIGVVVAGISGSAGNGLNQLNNPQAVYVDSARNIFVADINNTRVIKFPAGSSSGTNGIVVVQTGSLNPGNTAIAPFSVFVDKIGRIYTGTNSGKAQVYRYPANSSATTAGTSVAISGGTIGAAAYGLYVTSSFDIYFSAYQEHAVYKTANGSASTTGTVVAGTANVTGTALRNLWNPRGIYVDNSNNLYVADLSNHRVISFPAGSTTTTLGTVATSFTSPFGVSIDPTTGNIFTVGGANLRKTTKASRLIPNEGGSYTVTYTNGTCATPVSASITVTDPITINTQPSTVGQTVCKNSIATSLTVSATVSGTTINGYQWYSNTSNSTVGGTAISSATSSSYTPATTAAGTTYYYAKISTASGCSKLSAVSGAILVNEIPTALTVTSPQTFCSAAIASPTINNLTNGTPTGTNSITWYTASTGGTALLGSQTLTTTTYYMAQTDGTCESARSAVVVNVVTTPAAPTASSAQSFCSANNATVANLSATAIGTNTIKWYSSASLGSSLLSGTVSLRTGTTYYTTQTTSTGCESGSASVTVTINPTPSAPTASTQNLCASTIPTVGNLVANVEAGNTAKWYTVAIAGSALSNTTAIVNSGVYYVAQLSAANCESGRILVNVIAGPTTPLMSAGVCVGNTITASLVDRNASSLSWYRNGSLLSNVNTFSDTLSNVANIPGGYQNLFIDSTGNVYVATTSDNHSILMYAPGSSTGVIVAGGNGAGSALNQFNKPQGVYVDNARNIYVADYLNNRVMKFPAGSTSLTNGVVVASITAPYSVFVDKNGSIYAGTNNGNARVFRYPANSTSTTVGTQVAQNSGANAAVAGVYVTPSLDIYFSSYQEHVVYKTPAGSTANATVVAGTINSAGNSSTKLSIPLGIFVDSTNNLFVADFNNNRIMRFPAGSTTTTPGTVLTTLAAKSYGISIDPSTGNYFTLTSTNLQKLTKAAKLIPNEGGNYTVTYTNGTCATPVSASITVTDPITINTQPSTLGQSLCRNTIATSLTVSATVSGTTINGYEWYSNTTNSTQGGTIISGATSSSYTPTTTAVGTTYYYAKIKTASGCSKLSAVSGAIVVSTQPVTLIPTATQTFCSALSASPTIADLNFGTKAAVTNTISWYAAATGGTALLGSNTLTSTTYYVTQSDGACESVRAAVVVNVISSPAAPTASSAQSFCSVNNNTVASLTATAAGSNTLKWYSSSSLSSSVLSSTVSLTTATTYYVTQTTSTGCESGSASVTVTINPTPSAPTAATQSFCSENNPTISNLVATGNVGSTFLWYAAATGGASISSSSSVSSGIYYVSQVSASNCESARTPVNIISGPSNPALSSATSCVGVTLVANLIDANIDSFTWYDGSTSISSLTNSDLRDSSLTLISSVAGLSSIFVDANGNTYFRRSSDNTIVKTAPGSSSPIIVANASATGVSTFGSPDGIFVDASSNLYVADNTNRRVLKFTPNNTTGTVIATTINNPTAIYVDNSGYLYVADAISGKVFGYPAGSTSTTVGTLVADLRTVATAATYPSGNNLSIYGLSVVNNTLYISCSQLHAVFKFPLNVSNPVTAVTAIAGSVYSLGADLAKMNSPMGIYVDSVKGIFVADKSNNRIVKYPLTATAGSAGTIQGGSTFINPIGVAKDPTTGNILVTDNGNNRIQKLYKVAYYTATEAGNYKVKYSNGTCNSGFSNSISITDPFTISSQPSTTKQSLCIGSTATTLTIAASSSIGSVTYKWFSNSKNSTTGGTEISGQTTSSYTPATSTSDSTFYYVKITSGSCSRFSAVSGAIVVTVKPSTLTASNQIFCSANNPAPRIANLSVSGVTGSNSLKWYTVSSAGTAVDTANYLLVNNTSYYVSQFDGTCESNRTAILVNLGTTPAAPTVAASQGFCYNPSSIPTVASLTASAAPGNTVKWYLSSLGGTALASSTPLVNGTTYYASQTLSSTSSCESSLSTGLTVTIYASSANITPTMVINNPSAACTPGVVDLTTSEVTAGSTSGLTFTYFTNIGATNVLSIPTAVGLAGTYYIKGTTVGGCASAVAPVTVTISPIPDLTKTALNFDGVDDYVKMSSKIVDLNRADFTVETWLRTTASASTRSTQGIFNQRNDDAIWNSGERLFYLDGGYPRLVGNGCSWINSNNTARVDDGNWHHIAWVWDYTGNGTDGVGNAKIYIDGVDRSGVSNYQANSQPPSDATFRFGQINNSETNNPFIGSLDNVRIWQTARTADQIATYKDSISTGSETGLLAYYDFNQGIPAGTNSSVTSLIDRTTAGTFTGTLNNFALSGASSNWVESPIVGENKLTSVTESVCLGSTGTNISIVISGSSLTPQWYKNSSNTTVGGTLITGATNTSYAPQETVAGTYYYYLKASNASGCSVTSNVSNPITFLPAPSATITSSATLGFDCTSSSITLESSTGVVSPTYQWQVSTNSGSTWSNVSSNGTSANYSATAAGQYRVVITKNGCSTNSNVTTVLAAPSSSASSTAICQGGSSTFTVDATGYTSPTYQWQVSTNSGGSWSNVASNGTSQNYSASSAGQYRVIVTGTNLTGTTCPITLTVNALPAVTMVNSAVSICSGQTGTLSSTTSESSISYQWKKAGVNIAGATSSSYSSTEAGTYTLVAKNSNGCETTLTSTISIISANTISLSSIAGTNTQTVCNGDTIKNITYTTSGATGASFTGLPSGVSGAWLNNVVTISGTPANEGIFNYTINLTGGCATVTATGTIRVNAINTITLNSSASTISQTICVNTPITFITYQTTGATGATVTGLPTGVTANWLNNLVTISGTPSVSGSFKYIVTLTGGCSVIKDSGTIVSSANQTVSLSSELSTTRQSLCVNGPIADITYSTTGATGASFSGLPAGVTGTWSNSTITISGTPSVTGSFAYTVTLTGGCSTASSSGTFTVTKANTISLQSAINSDTISICAKLSISNIVYRTTGATGATFNGLPEGVTGEWKDSVITISGSPANEGEYFYEVVLTGGCAGISAKGKITVIRIPGDPVSSVTQPTCSVATGSIDFSSLGTGYQYSVDQINFQTTTLFSSLVAGTYNIVVKNAGGCLSNASAVIIRSQPLTPSVPIITSSPSATVCEGTAVNLTASNADSYQWYNNNVIIAGATSKEYITSLSGNFKVTIVNTSGCSATSTSTVVTVNSIPTASILEGSTLAFNDCINTSLTLTAISNAGSPTYQWFKNGIEMSGEVASVLKVEEEGQYSVKVTSLGCTNYSAQSKVLSVPSLTNTGNSTICDGKKVVLNVSPLGFDTPTYQWKVKPLGETTYQNVSSSGNTSSYEALVSGDYLVTVVDRFSNSSNSCPLAITVNSLPTVSVEVSPSSTICAGIVDTLSAIATSGSSTMISSYQWKTSGVNIESQTASIFTTPTSGNYSVLVTDDNGCQRTSATSVIAVNPLPTLQITNPPTVCSPAVVNLTANNVTAGSTGSLTYSYYKDSLGTIVLSNPSTVSIAGTYYIKGITAGGCSSVIKPVEVTITNPLLVITNPEPVCAPFTIDLRNTRITAGSSDGLTFTYFTDSAATNSLNYFTSLSAGRGTYYIKGTNSNGCISIRPIVVSVVDLPTLVITNPAPVCKPAVVDITSASVLAGSSTGTALRYFRDNTLLDTLRTPNAISSSGTYYIQSTNSTGCVSLGSVNVSILEQPTVAAITGTTALCAGSTTVLSNSVAGGVWSSSNVAVATVNSSGLVTGIAGGTVTITYTVSNGYCAVAANALVTVNALPALTAITGSSILCAGTTTALSNSVAGGVWSSSNLSVATVNSLGMVTGIAGGTATISYTVSNTYCTNTTTTVVTVNALSALTAITGNTTVEVGLTTTLSNANSGGVWSSSNSSLAPIDAIGVVTGIAAGNVTISYTVTNSSGCISSVSTNVTINPSAINPKITGSSTVCVGSTSTLINSIDGGVWSSSNSSIATINSSGVVTGISAGTTIISYTITRGSSTSVATFTVVVTAMIPVPVVSNTTPFCIGSNTEFSTNVSGGVWSVGDTNIVKINSLGIVKAIAAGTSEIIYTIPNNIFCYSSARVSITINPLPTVLINQPAAVCSPAVVDLTTDSITARSSAGLNFSYWKNSAATQVVASPGVINTSGTYYVKGTNPTTGCFVIQPVNVTIQSSSILPNITGATEICAGTSAALANATAGGVWSNSNTRLATISSAGVVTGLFVGIDTISYAVTSASGCINKTISILKIKNCLPPLEIVEKISKPVIQGDGTYNVTISIYVKNPSAFNFDSVQLSNDLKKTFISPTTFKLKSLNAFGSLVANSSFDGNANKDLLTYKSKVMANQRDSVVLVVNFSANGFVGNLFNQTDLNALSPYGWVTNTSSNLDELTGSISLAPSKFVIEEIEIFVPDAFSPNGDGVNDRFQIGRPSNTKVSLSVYNRWGVMVYTNDNYANEWDGYGVGSFLGKKLLEGTYFYNVTIRYSNPALNKKLAGYITLKR